MKGILAKTLLLGSLSIACTFTYAVSNNYNNNNHNNNAKSNMPAKLWICETNASSSSNPNDMKADEQMKKGAKSASKAFEMAFKHCRDCNKIECKLETNA